MGTIRETTLQIDLTALTHNFRFLKSKIDVGTKFLGVVKAFAYGSEMVTIAQKLQELGADYLAVAYTKEGVLLRKAGIRLPILVLHPQEVNFDALIANCLEPSLYSFRILEAFMKKAESLDQKAYPVHINLNTGLNRLGFLATDAERIIHVIKKNDSVKTQSLFSHLAASEDLSERTFSLQQIACFEKFSEEYAQRLGIMPMRHMLNTSGVLNYSKAQFEMVRCGIGLYGYGNQKEVDVLLKPVASLKTIISQIHQVGCGQSVGYNRAFTAKQPRVTATLPIGHADGVGRQYGGGHTFVSINNQKAPIIGNVCMDMVMIDVTGIDCKEGDEVLVFGAEASADELAQTGNTISYEILTAISQRVGRQIVG